LDYDFLVLAGSFTLLSAIITYPVCKIYKRAGFKWYWGLATLVPMAGFFAMFGALGFTKWPSTSAKPSGATGAHSLYWVAGFSALFIFGIPGTESEQGQAVLQLIFLIYVVGSVAEIYKNAGYSGWGGIMGFLGITNLIWPWLIAYREWPSVVFYEDIKKSEVEQDRLRDAETAEKFGIQPDEIEAYESEQYSSKQFVESPVSEDVVTPPPIPVPNRSKPIATQTSDPIKAPVNIETEEGGETAEDLFDFYEKIAAELKGYRPRVEGVYLRAQMESDGDEEKTRLLYSKYRLERFLAKE